MIVAFDILHEFLAGVNMGNLAKYHDEKEGCLLECLKCGNVQRGGYRCLLGCNAGRINIEASSYNGKHKAFFVAPDILHKNLTYLDKEMGCV